MHPVVSTSFLLSLVAIALTFTAENGIVINAPDEPPTLDLKIRSPAIRNVDSAMLQRKFMAAAHEVDKISEFYNVECYNRSDISVELYAFVPTLPNICNSVRLCDSKSCINLGKQSLLFVSDAGPNRIHNVTTRDTGLQSRCDILRIEQYDDNYVPRMRRDLPTRVMSLLMHFNLPGYRYCGPGTNIAAMDNAGGPVNALDNLCRLHDLDYKIGTHPVIADRALVDSVKMINHPLAPIFENVFEAKRIFEDKFGFEYTSFLYFDELTGQADKVLTYRESMQFSRLGHYENVTAYLEGNRRENAWSEAVKNAWVGECINPALAASRIRQCGNEDTEPSDNSGWLSPSTSGQGSVQGTQFGDIVLDQEDPDDDSIPKTTIAYPPIPPFYEGCRILINEVSSSCDDPSGFQFVELGKWCPDEALKKNSLTLSGYVLLVIRGGHAPAIVFSADLSDSLMVEYNSEIQSSLKALYVVGDNNMPVVHKKFDTCVITDIRHKIPAGRHEPYAVVLLRFPYRSKSKPLVLLTKHYVTHLGMNKPISGSTFADASAEIIRAHLQDMIVYGDTCEPDLCIIFEKLFPSFSEAYSKGIMKDDAKYEDTPGKAYASLSRCAMNSLPMQINEFRTAKATPGEMNACPAPEQRGDGYTASFKMQGKLIQTTGIQITLNVHNYFLQAKKQPLLLSETPLRMTSRATNIGRKSLTKMMNNAKEGIIETPKVPTKRRCAVRDQIDTFDLDMIRRIISDFYAKNQAPTAMDVFNEFMKQKRENEQTQAKYARLHTNELPDTESASDNAREQMIFKCSEKTFRKVLHSLRYKYGTIGKRDVLIMKDYIVEWRGRYLRRLRENNKLVEPLPIIYTDETWIDPFSRTAKGWIPAKCVSFRDRARHSFKTTRGMRGPRLIVLAAGGAGGMIDGSSLVYRIDTKDVLADYHGNVNQDVYNRWFKKLLDDLDATKKKYIIVMDNASYHGSSTAPRSNDLKLTIYNWLTEQKNNGEDITLPDFGKIRKWELWEMVKQLKQRNSYYAVDTEARSRGHEILRLPPWNCDLNPIEYVWKDIKTEVRRQNTDQDVEVVKTITEECLATYSSEDWKKHIGHVNNLGEQYWTQDGHFDSTMSKLSVVIPSDEEYYDDSDDDMPTLDMYGDDDFDEGPGFSDVDRRMPILPRQLVFDDDVQDP